MITLNDAQQGITTNPDVKGLSFSINGSELDQSVKIPCNKRNYLALSILLPFMWTGEAEERTRDSLKRTCCFREDSLAVPFLLTHTLSTTHKSFGCTNSYRVLYYGLNIKRALLSKKSVV